jgi:hypothetical protein
VDALADLEPPACGSDHKSKAVLDSPRIASNSTNYALSATSGLKRSSALWSHAFGHNLFPPAGEPSVWPFSFY